MGITDVYDRALRKELKCRANLIHFGLPAGLGDYGDIVKGLFVKRGNISEFGVSFETEEGKETTLNFTSKRASRVTVDAEGNILESLPDTDIQATIKITFEKADSVLLKSNKVKATQIANTDAVAHALKNATAQDGREWNKGWCVVWQVFTGNDTVLIGTKTAGTTIKIGGTASALKQFDLGSASANLELSLNKDVSLEVTGDNIDIGINLFKLTLFGGIRSKSADGDGLGADILDDFDNPLEDTI